jgi:hypothetical protein
LYSADFYCTVLWIRRRLLLHTLYVIEAALHDRARS